MAEKINSFEKFDLLVKTQVDQRHPLFRYKPDWIIEPSNAPIMTRQVNPASTQEGVWSLEPNLVIRKVLYDKKGNKLIVTVDNISTSPITLVARGVNYTPGGNINFANLNTDLRLGSGCVEIDCVNDPHKFVLRTNKQTANGWVRPDNGWDNC